MGLNYTEEHHTAPARFGSPKATDVDREMAKGLNRLGGAALAINKANGWDVCQPSDWTDSGPAGLGLDMDKAVADKLAKNRRRGHKHGGKRL